MNNRGRIKDTPILGMLMLIGGLFIVALLGLAMLIGSSAINYVMDETVPELSGLGMVGDFNATHAVDVAIDPVNSLIQSFTWISAFVYIVAIISLGGLAMMFRNTGQGWLVGLYFVLSIVLVLGTILISNIYEDVVADTNELTVIMAEHSLLSLFVLNGPMIMTIIVFILGIILFSNPQEVVY